MSGTHGAPAEPFPCCTEHRGAECVPWPAGVTDAYALFTKGDYLHDAIVTIGTSRERMDLEMYIYAADEVDWRMGEALAAKACTGVQVRLLVDATGFRGAGWSSIG